MKKKKILFLITKSNWGGAQRYVFDLATHLPAEHFDITVALGGDGILIEQLEQAGIKVIHIDGLQRNISFTQELKASREILHILSQEKPDILHINSSKAGLFGALIGRITGVNRIVFTAHGWAFNENRSLLARFIFKYFHWLTILFAHKTITVSKALKKQMGWPFVQKKISVVHNGRTVPHFLEKDTARAFLIQQQPALKQFAHDTWTGTIAELHKIKGHDVMIETIAELVASGHNLRHLIIGDGEEYGQLKKLIKDKELQKHIFLLGHINEAAQYLKAFDIFTLTSRSEALGYVLIEAMYAGLPIISSEVGGIPEIIEHRKNGLLVQSENPAALADTLKNILKNKAEQEKLKNNALTASKAFMVETMLAETQEIYRKQ